MMPHNGVYSGLVPRRGYAMHQTGQAGLALGIGGGALAFIAILVAIGIAPGTLIAHYGFGVKWGKSIAIGFGVMLGLGVLDKMFSRAPTAVITVPPAGAGSLATQAVQQASGHLYRDDAPGGTGSDQRNRGGGAATIDDPRERQPPPPPSAHGN